MALVRRLMLWAESPAAKTAAQAVEHVVVPRQPSAAPTTASAPQAPAGSPVPVDGPEQAAAAPTVGAHTLSIVLAFALVAAGALASWLMPDRPPFRLGSAAATYGGLLVFAGAVERLLEPFSHWLPGRHARNDYEQAVASMMNQQQDASLAAVAKAKARMERAVADRSVIVWGIATAVSTVIAAASGFYLLRAIASADWTPTVPAWIDALITGLVVGSGTKPLHDLITRAQSSKGSTTPQG